MTTRSRPQDTQTAAFIEEVTGTSPLRVEYDFGDGFVRLKTSEAEKRQAAQDIQSSEDIVIELLRNARDAGATNIFLATQTEQNMRSIVVIDDGCGIPDGMFERIFEPRVTSKLDSAVMDRWGIHGRGMALYSIQVHAQEANVVCSSLGLGSAISVTTNLTSLKEKTDQSTFPRFEMSQGTLMMRGPKNILRIASEFALEHKDSLNVYCGSFTEIAAALNEFAMATVNPRRRAFKEGMDEVKLTQRFAFAEDPEDFAQIAASLGLPLSIRSCRRIMDGQTAAAPTLLNRLTCESMATQQTQVKRRCHGSKQPRTPHFTPDDIAELSEGVESIFAPLAKRYFLDSTAKPHIAVINGKLRIDIDLVDRS